MRVAHAGYEVVIGSRDASRAAAIVDEMSWPEGVRVRGVSNEEAALADLVVIATPSDSAVETATSLADALSGKVVISMVNALSRENKQIIPVYPPRGSMAAEIAAALPNSRLVGAFHHLPAGPMQDLASGLDADVILFSDDAEAMASVEEMVRAMPGLRPLAGGTMGIASAVEAFTAVCISINIRQRANSYVKMWGLPS